MSTLIACDSATAPGSGDREVPIHVYSVLVAGADTAKVLIARPGSWNATRPGAAEVVSLRTGSDTIHLRSTGDDLRPCGEHLGATDWTLRCFAGAVPGGVRPGRSYDLDIEVPGRETVHGNVTVPLPPTFVLPSAGEELTIADKATSDGADGWSLVRWERATEGRRFIELDVELDEPGCRVQISSSLFADNQMRLRTSHFDGDSARVRLHSLTCQPAAGAGGGEAPAQGRERFEARLVITMFDTAYTRYQEVYDVSSSVAQTNKAFGLAGAAGVFSAASSAYHPIVLLPPNPP